MGFLENLELHWWWLIVAAVLGVLEIMLPGVFLIWLAIAAAVTGIAVALVEIPFGYQIVLFTVLAFASVYAGRRVYARNPVPSSDPKLNDRTARLIGQTVTVESAILNGQGRVRIGDSVWNARGPDAPAGSQVVVVAADGSCLNVALPAA